MHARALLLLALTAGCQASTSTEPDAGASSSIALPPAAPDPIAEYAGRWIRRGPYDIIARGHDTIWSIERGASGWMIRMTIVDHPSVNVDPRIVTRQDFEPVALAWVGEAFEFEHPRPPHRVERITVDLDGDKLYFPALVQRDGRTWEYRGWSEGGVIQCAHDPLKVPTGSADHPFNNWNGPPSTYRTKQVDSIYARGERVTAIEFFQTPPQGVEQSLAELILERPPHRHWIRKPHTSAWNAVVYERLSDEDWHAVLALPRSTGERRF